MLCCFDAGGVKAWCCVFKSDVRDGCVWCFDVKQWHVCGSAV